MPADLILKNAGVITMNPHQPHAGLVAVKDNRIIFVGDNTELASLKGRQTKVIDCTGKTVIPGFNDAHCHIFSLLRKQFSIDLSPASVHSIADIKEVIRRKAETTPPGQWISGAGFNEFYLAEKRFPHRWDIDAVAPHHPVILSHRSLHACVLNSMALELAGINIETPEPPGAIIDRHPSTGEPDGILFEMLGYIRQKIMPPPTDEELDWSVSQANHHYLSLGITSLQEATVSNDVERWNIYHRFKEKDQLKSRISMMVGFTALQQFIEAEMLYRYGNDHLRLGAVKILVEETTGRLQPKQSELNRQVMAAHKAGFQAALHAIEPNTVEAAITALEYVKEQLPQENRRHRIEHCAVCPPPLLERLSRLKAVIATQPPFVYYNGERYLATVPAADQPWLYRIKSPLDKGLVVAASSDSPIVPDNPFMGIYTTVTRQTESGQYLLPSEKVSVQQALEMYTVNSAYASGDDDSKGSIAPGKLADLIMLSANPLTVSPEELKNIRVEMTIIDGKVVWEA